MRGAYLDMQDIFLEVPIMIISLISLPIVLVDIYKQYYHKSIVSTKKTLFIMQLISSLMWIILGVMNKQWFMLLSATNNILQSIVILFYIHRINSTHFQVVPHWTKTRAPSVRSTQHMNNSIVLIGAFICKRLVPGLYRL